MKAGNILPKNVKIGKTYWICDYRLNVNLKRPSFRNFARRLKPTKVQAIHNKHHKIAFIPFNKDGKLMHKKAILLRIHGPHDLQICSTEQICNEVFKEQAKDVLQQAKRDFEEVQIIYEKLVNEINKEL